MVGYGLIEDAFIEKLLSKFPQLNDTRCKAGDLDGVIEAIFSENANVGCVVEFGGAQKFKKEGFSQPIWTWSYACLFFIRFSDTVEKDLRTIVSTIATLVEGDQRLGGVTYLAEVYEIATPEVVDIADVPFYMVPFVLDAVDR